MSVESHLDQLRTKHQALDAQIKEEEQRPARDDLEVRALKRRKLQLKEEIERLTATVH